MSNSQSFGIVDVIVYLQLTFYIIFKLLHFSKSLVNMIMYPLRIPEFKNTLLQIIRCFVVPFQRLNVKISLPAESGSVVSLRRFTNSQFSSPNFK